jgi:hypothetical protein
MAGSQNWTHKKCYIDYTKLENVISYHGHCVEFHVKIDVNKKNLKPMH